MKSNVGKLGLYYQGIDPVSLHKIIMYIKVKVQAGAKEEKFEKINNDTYKIKVKQKAERNMANDRVIFLLAENLKLSENKIRLISGHHSPSKIFSIM